jgi:hypothetical protein
VRTDETQSARNQPAHVALYVSGSPATCRASFATSSAS